MNPITSYCGLDCNECSYRELAGCQGCVATKGHPFYRECELANCAKSRQVRFCGECADIPCKMLTDYSNDEEHGDTPKGARISRCNEIKAALVKEARKGMEPVSYCGHHCDYCFLGQWCGGCRSDYNCCSFATLFEDKQCPNVFCAKIKSLEGCYQCEELSSCKVGYYGKEEEYVAKATALFIKEYGLDCYKATLKRCVEEKVGYPKDFDATGSVEGAFAILVARKVEP
ncbi:hypothetical protein lbkm_1737 [Lachnospiraceae bacterium KM106-2]|nr:hypothetical protein lbkm_1737 [Lachnospiraceae bacterium KM106-2]